MPPTQVEADFPYCGQNGGLDGSGRYLEVSIIAVGFIFTRFQPEYSIPRPFQNKNADLVGFRLIWTDLSCFGTIWKWDQKGVKWFWEVFRSAYYCRSIYFHQFSARILDSRAISEQEC